MCEGSRHRTQRGLRRTRRGHFEVYVIPESTQKPALLVERCADKLPIHIPNLYTVSVARGTKLVGRMPGNCCHLLLRDVSFAPRDAVHKALASSEDLGGGQQGKNTRAVQKHKSPWVATCRRGPGARDALRRDCHAIQLHSYDCTA